MPLGAFLRRKCRWKGIAFSSLTGRAGGLLKTNNLILFVLHGLCDFPLGYRGEKPHWIVPFAYRGLSCAISLEKFGVRLYVAKDENTHINKNELLGKLKKAVEATEKHILAEIAEDQIKSGNITIANQFHRLGNQYIYFREKAESAYSPPTQEPNDGSVDGLAELLNRSFRASAEGAFNALAMVKFKKVGNFW